MSRAAERRSESAAQPSKRGLRGAGPEAANTLVLRRVVVGRSSAPFERRSPRRRPASPQVGHSATGPLLLVSTVRSAVGRPQPAYRRHTGAPGVGNTARKRCELAGYCVARDALRGRESQAIPWRSRKPGHGSALFIPVRLWGHVDEGWSPEL